MKTTQKRRRAERDQEIYRRVRYEGRSHVEVSREFGISTRHVRRILKTLEDDMSALSRVSEPPEVRQLHLARLEHQWRETMMAWYRSLHGEEITKVTRRGQGDQDTIIEQTRRKQNGDVKYLEYARKLMEEMRALGGVTPPLEQGADYVDVRTLTIEQRRLAFDRTMEELRQRALSDAGDRVSLGATARLSSA